MAVTEGPTWCNAAETRQRSFHLYQVECQSELEIELSKACVFSCLRLPIVKPVFGSGISKVKFLKLQEKLSSVSICMCPTCEHKRIKCALFRFCPLPPLILTTTYL